MENGNRDYAALEQQAAANLKQAGWQVDYVEIRHSGNLQVAHVGDSELVVLAAARLGNTRLIDNIEIRL